MKAMKLLFAATAALAMAFTAQAEKTAKAVLADGGKTLKFVYDETSYGTKGTHWFSVADAEAADPQTGIMPWWGLRNSITKVVFDGSFAACRPRHCGAWFNAFRQLETVDGLGNLDVSEATSLTMMFADCLSLTTLDCSAFDTSKVTDMSYMFFGCSSLGRIFVSDMFTAAAVTASGGMFKNCTALVGGNGTAYDSDRVDKTYARIDSGESAPGYFTAPVAKVIVEDYGKTLRFVYDGKDYEGEQGTDWFKVEGQMARYGYVPWSSRCSYTVKVVFDRPFVAYRPKRCSYWFNQFLYLTTVEGVENLNTSAATDMAFMFYKCSKLTSLDLSRADTSRVTNMSYMFADCSSLTTLNVSGFDTSDVTDMAYMFSNCSVLKSLDVSGFDTSKVLSMSTMFYNCASLKALDVSGFKTAEVTDMGTMFRGCSSLTSLVLPGFVTSKVTNMEYMFTDCESLESLDLSGFDTSKVTRMDGMFWGCSALTSLNVSGFDVSQLEDLSFMFSGCSSLKSIDLSGFNTAKVTDMSSMFLNCSSLQTIGVSDLFVSAAVTLSELMFSGCWNLAGGNGTEYDETAPTGKTYARIDKAGQPGYFTRVPVYIVVFDGNGATAGTMASCAYKRGEVHALPKCAFKKTGKAFKGWRGSNGRRYDDGVLVFNAAEEGKTLTLTAIWE